MVVALSGLILVGFVIGHMLGNLKFFGGLDPVTGQHTLDHYGHMLRVFASDFVGDYTFLWIVRIVLLAALFLHVLTVILLTRQNRKARAGSYSEIDYQSATFSSRSMLIGGLFLLAFVVLHILHFTTGDIHFQGFTYGEVFNNVVKAFSLWYVVVAYIFAMVWLALHLYHGAWSMFQTLGLDSPGWNNGLRTGAKVLAVILFLGFCSVPIAVYFGSYPLIYGK